MNPGSVEGMIVDPVLDEQGQPIPITAVPSEKPLPSRPRKPGVRYPNLRLNREGQWVHNYRADGRRHRVRYGTDYEIALARYLETERLAATGKGLPAGSSNMLFAEFSEIWWEGVEQTLSPATRIKWRGILDQHLIPTFGAVRLKHLSGDRIGRHLGDRRRAGAAANTAIATRTVLQHLLNRATDWHYLDRNPMNKASGKLIPDLKIKTPDPVTRWLSPLEEKQVLKHCAKYPLLRELVIVALHTGARRNELLAIKRSDINWDSANATVTLHATKTGHSRTVPLNTEALAALRSVPVRMDGRVFPQKPKQVTDAFKTACVRAGLLDVHFHCLRHSFGTRLIAAGVALPAVAGMMGHASIRMTLRYVHLADAYHREAVEKLVAVPADGEVAALG